MPFIEAKVTTPVSSEAKEVIKERLGNAITVFPGKSETFLMVGFIENYPLYFGGQNLDKGAFIDVKIFGKANNESYDKMTEAVCQIFEEELYIPADKIYVTYEEVDHWGWNGKNF